MWMCVYVCKCACMSVYMCANVCGCMFVNVCANLCLFLFRKSLKHELKNPSNQNTMHVQVCMMCDHWRQSAEWTFALDNLNLG